MINIKPTQLVTSSATRGRLSNDLLKFANLKERDTTFQRTLFSWVKNVANQENLRQLEEYVDNPFSQPFIQNFVNSIVNEVSEQKEGEQTQEDILKYLEFMFRINSNESQKLYKAWFDQ